MGVGLLPLNAHMRMRRLGLKTPPPKNMPTLDLQAKKVRQCTQLPTQLAEVTPQLSGIRRTTKFGQNDALIGLY